MVILILHLVASFIDGSRSHSRHTAEVNYYNKLMSSEKMAFMALAVRSVGRPPPLQH